MTLMKILVMTTMVTDISVGGQSQPQALEFNVNHYLQFTLMTAFEDSEPRASERRLGAGSQVIDTRMDQIDHIIKFCIDQAKDSFCTLWWLSCNPNPS